MRRKLVETISLYTIIQLLTDISLIKLIKEFFLLLYMIPPLLTDCLPFGIGTKAHFGVI